MRYLEVPRSLRLIVDETDKTIQLNRKESNSMENATQPKWSNAKLQTLAGDKARGQTAWNESATLREEFATFEIMWAFISNLGQSNVVKSAEIHDQLSALHGKKEDAQKAWDASEALRAEFEDFESMLLYIEKLAAGQTQVLGDRVVQGKDLKD